MKHGGLRRHRGGQGEIAHLLFVLEDRDPVLGVKACLLPLVGWGRGGCSVGGSDSRSFEQPKVYA